MAGRNDEKSDAKYKRKYKALKIQLISAENEADGIVKKLAKYDKTLKQLQVERKFLLEKLKELKTAQDSDSEDSNASGEGAILEEKKKPKKDPNAPKRPSNAFFMYCQMERNNLRKTNMEASLSDLTKMLGDQWKNMSKEEKQRYYDMYEDDKVRYEKEMSNYNVPGTVLEPEQDRSLVDEPSYDGEELDTDRNQDLGREQEVDREEEDEVEERNNDYNSPSGGSNQSSPIGSSQ